MTRRNPRGRPPITRARVLRYYAATAGHRPDTAIAKDLGMSVTVFRNARQELVRMGYLELARYPRPQGGRPWVLARLTKRYRPLFRTWLGGDVERNGSAFPDLLYKALGPGVPDPQPKSLSPRAITRRSGKAKSVKGGGMKFIRLVTPDGPPASLARVGEAPLEEAPFAQFIKLFRSEYRKRFGTRYVGRREDSRHAKRLTDAHELGLLEEMVRLFVAMDGYGQPNIRHFYVRSEELLVGARERISDRAKDGIERESMTLEDRQEYTIKEITDALFYGTITDAQRRVAKRLVSGWPEAKLYARYTQEVVRASMTDKQWERHVNAREEYGARRWQ